MRCDPGGLRRVESSLLPASQVMTILYYDLQLDALAPCTHRLSRNVSQASGAHGALPGAPL